MVLVCFFGNCLGPSCFFQEAIFPSMIPDQLGSSKLESFSSKLLLCYENPKGVWN